jgi:hypothetical protein
MKTKRTRQKRIPSTPKPDVGADVRRLKSKRIKKSLSLVTSTPTRKRVSVLASLPTPLERDTLLTPLWVAESVVQEVERFLQAELPASFAERLAARAHHLYPRHAHFRKGLNRPGNRGRENLLMFMRHWTAGWLKRERPALYRQLPREFAQGIRLTTGPGRSIL